MRTLTEVVQIAKRSLTRDGYLASVLLIEGTRGRIVKPYVVLPEREKLFLMEALGHTLAVADQIGNLQQAFLVSEAWLNRNPQVSPAKDPNRIEVVVVNQYDARTHTADLALYEMVRGKAGSLTELKTIEAPEANTFKLIRCPPLDALVSGFMRGRAPERRQAS